jgi:hypothetical protein
MAASNSSSFVSASLSYFMEDAKWDNEYQQQSAESSSPLRRQKQPDAATATKRTPTNQP